MSSDLSANSEHELSLSLLENGLDFIVKGLDELYGKGHLLKGAKATEFDPRNYKYGVTNLFAGFMLLLKERLSRHMLELIFTGKLTDVKQKLKSNRKIPATVGLDEALERLEIGPKVTFLGDDLEVIKRVQDLRNQFEHYQVKANKYQLWAELTKFIDIIERFLIRELAIDLSQYSSTSQALHKKAQVIRKEVVAFDSVLEQRAYETLRYVSGRQVPGDLLNTDRPIVLPTIQGRGHALQSVSGRRYIPDFEGENEESRWIIEIKGAYVTNGLRFALDQLGNAIYLHGTAKLQAWLIVFGDVPVEIKEQAKTYGIYLTDLESWQQLEQMSKE